MKKYAISREFFPWNLFAPPISENFLAMAVPHMKPPKSLWRDKELDVITHEITSYDGEKITDTPMWNSSLSDRIGPMTKVDSSRPDYILYSPVEAPSFEGLPPAYIETAEFDCLHDDGILYASLLRNAGIEVTLNKTKGTMHGFDIATKAPTTLAAMEQRIAFMKRMV